MFWIRFSKLCELNHVSPSKATAEMGLSNGLTPKWKTGSIPNAGILMSIADYFGCSVDYLLGRSDAPSNPASEASNSHVGDLTISGNAQISGNAVIGSGNNVGCTISVDEQQLLEMFRSLDLLKKTQVVSLIDTLCKEM